jgi:hypothetical protein
MNFGFDESPLGSYTPRRFAFPANPVRGDGFGFSADRLSILLRFRPVAPLLRIWVHPGGEPNHDPAVNVKAPANVPSAAGQDGGIGGSPTRERREVTAPEAALNE